jgi:hypothetical protein
MKVSAHYIVTILELHVLGNLGNQNMKYYILVLKVKT